MKSVIIGFIFLIFQTVTLQQAQAQQAPNKRVKEIETIKIGFITRRLDLTPEESQKFWPIYNLYQKDISIINQQKREARVQNNADPEKLVDDDFNFESKILELRKKYRIRFSKIISPEKVKLLYMAEREFREELIKHLRKRDQSQQ